MKKILIALIAGLVTFAVVSVPIAEAKAKKGRHIASKKSHGKKGKHKKHK